ncbi:atp-binding cassette superfamily [Stylonychia lemnae]|uniref:Atp-binding cassette superfamily n=1 Tax=Stylonychia lemnae TaxID=5949 RepID=A0A078AVS1_STYLE|nr:atp-binding cassette superfamily [Stylonychia lemnae]|eukprot:CDW86515.1 atp-binding cassette superfamily [Stylonychia lemnae]
MDQSLLAKNDRTLDQSQHQDLIKNDLRQFMPEQEIKEMGIWNKLFFSWANGLISFAKKNQIHINQMGKIKDQDRVELQYNKLKKSWKLYKNRKGNSLFKAVLHAYRYEYFIAVIFNLVVTSIEISSPLLIKRIIDYIQDPDEEQYIGFLLVTTLIVTQGFKYILSDHLDYYQRLIGVRSTNAMIALIYNKTLKVSSATNKKFSNGEIVNFIQVDAQKLNIISENLATVLKQPVLLITCIVLLFHYMGSSFLAGVAVTAAAFCVNLFVNKFSTRYQTAYMKLQDQRVNLTTECLNNIKMLKLYSWQEAFERMIGQKRSEELAVLWKIFTVSCVNMTSQYFFPSILGAAVFSAYIGSGNTLDLSVAYTVNTIFNLLKSSQLQ